MLLALKRLEELLGRLLSVSLRIVLRPSPKVRTGVFKGKLGFPPQLLVCSSWVCGQIEDVASSSADDLVWQVTTHGVAKSLDHVENGAALAGTEVPGADTGVLGAEVVQGDEMAFCQIQDMNVVANGGAVLGLVV